MKENGNSHLCNNWMVSLAMVVGSGGCGCVERAVVCHPGQEGLCLGRDEATSWPRGFAGLLWGDGHLPLVL